jgi:putative transposase
MDAVAALSRGGSLIGASCAALGLSRASLHRRKRPARASRPRPKPMRALGRDERRAVLELLRAPRFIDLAPAEVYASLLYEGGYLVSGALTASCIDWSDPEDVADLSGIGSHIWLTI